MVMTRTSDLKVMPDDHTDNSKNNRINMILQQLGDYS